jgi:integrase
MHEEPTTVMPAARVTGHLQVKVRGGKRKWYASYVDRDDVKRTRLLGLAHVKGSGKRTARGAPIWRAADGPCPAQHLTPKMAEDALATLLDEARTAPRRPRVLEPEATAGIPTFGDAIENWLTYLRVEKRRKTSTLQDARNVANAYLLPRFGKDTPLYAIERREVAVTSGGRERAQLREERRDTFTTDDVDDFRRDLLATDLSPRSVQKILVLLHGVFKLAKRRKLILSNPSEDAERVTVEDPGVFNVLEPAEFEAVYHAVLGELDERSEEEQEEDDAIDDLDEAQRELFGAVLSTSFYAGLRMGEMRDVPCRNVDFARAMLRVESGYTHGARSTPKGKRARSTPLVSVLEQRLTALSRRRSFTQPDDYVFCNEIGERVSDDKVRAVFYAALTRAGLGHRRAAEDVHGNPQTPMRVHDLRHSWCTWAVNVWPVTKVKEFAGHRDIKTTMRYVHHQTKAEDAELGGSYLAGVLSSEVDVAGAAA